MILVMLMSLFFDKIRGHRVVHKENVANLNLAPDLFYSCKMNVEFAIYITQLQRITYVHHFFPSVKLELDRKLTQFGPVVRCKFHGVM